MTTIAIILDDEDESFYCWGVSVAGVNGERNVVSKVSKEMIELKLDLFEIISMIGRRS